MAATVTIDKAYFETLLRRAELHTSGRDLSIPVEILTICIPKVDHDNLLLMAHEYASLRNSLYKGGIQPETLEVLIRGDDVPLPPADTFVGDDEHSNGGVDRFSRLQPARSTMTRSAGNFYENDGIERPPRSSGNDGYPGHPKGKAGFYNQDDLSFTPEYEKEDSGLATPRLERKQYAKTEQRTIVAKNLSDRATHQDIVDFVRGGTVLDIFLRSSERSASISFIEGSAAQDFLNYVKRHDIYVHGRRIEFSWNERQFVLPGHVANKIGIGATRNLVVRGVHSKITEERIRDDLEHIHNLVIINIAFENGDAYISLNSIHNALFARTCMMSRVTYKGQRIEWYPDECSQPLPKTHHVPKKDTLVPPPTKRSNPLANRFQMLNMDNEGTEDGSEETEDLPTVISDLPNLNINHRTPWSPRTVVA